MTATVTPIWQAGAAAAVAEQPAPVVLVHSGVRGAQGSQGPEGPQGEAGSSIRVLGQWQSGGTYAPNDGVTWNASVVQGVQSLYIQRDDVPASPSTVPPDQDLARWVEIGVTDISNLTGSLWTVTQSSHGFSLVGTPVAYSESLGRYVAADANSLTTIGIALVREVIDADRFILQSAGEITALDADVLLDGGDFVPGEFYYVATSPGKLHRRPPATTAAYSNPLLQATEVRAAPANQTGVVVPWTPRPNVVERVLVGQNRFYFTATAGQTIFSGEDDNGNTLEYVVGDTTDVYVNGANLFHDDFVATSGTAITLVTPLTAGAQVEVVTAAEDPAVIAPQSALKVDPINHLFDGVTTTFELLSGVMRLQIATPNVVTCMVDGVVQEPGSDFTVAPTQDSLGTNIIFAIPPKADTRFWAVVGKPMEALDVPGDVVGPPAAVANNIATFNGTTGKLIQDGGKTIAELLAEAGQVQSVFGRTEDVVAQAGDYDNLYTAVSAQNTTVNPLKIAVVNALPGSPDGSTLYFVRSTQ